MLELPLLVLHRTGKVCYISMFSSLNLRGEIPEGLNSQVLSFFGAWFAGKNLAQENYRS